MRQRWILSQVFSPYPLIIKPLFEESGINNPVMVIGNFKGRYVPFVSENITNSGSFNLGNNTNGYGFYFTTAPQGGGGGFPFPGEIIDPSKSKMFVQPESASSNDIKVDDDYYKGDQTKWEIIPVDEFRIEDINYDLTTSDKLSVIPMQIAVKTLVNDTDMPATRVISFQETITNESSFSETETLKVNVSTSTSAKVGIGKFFEGSFSMGVSTDKSWSYTVGNKETKSYTISESVTQEIFPRTTVKAELVATQYVARLTYIAQLYGINTGKTIYLKGKWDGVVVQESKVVLTQQGKVLKTINVTPKLKVAI